MNESNDQQTKNGSYSVLGTSYSALNRVLRLAQKELREILRDRRTIVTLIAMPLLLYPLMTVAFQQFYLASRITPDTGVQYHIGVMSDAEFQLVDRRVNRGQAIMQRGRAKTDEHAPVLDEKKKRSMPNFVWVRPKKEPKTPAERDEELENLKVSLRGGAIDLVVVIPDMRGVDAFRWPPVKDSLIPCQIYALSNSGPAQTALAHIEAALAACNEDDLKLRLQLEKAQPRINMLTMKRIMLDDQGDETVIKLAALVPLILILMTITGAVYPAIDLTAGERERGTLEILVAAPVSRFELLTAKYFSVLTVAVLTALVNLTCMMITLTWSGLGAAVLGQEGLSFGLLANLLGLLLLFAAFFSAVLLCLTSFARSFKEAQAYLIPLMMASLAPGIMAMLPGLELNRTLAALPLVNVVLLARDMFERDVDTVLAVIVVLTTLLYAFAALALAARVFGAESVLYSEQSSWADLLSRPTEKQPTATIPAMLWCLALMVPIHFALNAAARSLIATPPDGVSLVVAGVSVNLILFGLFPLLFVYLGRVDLRIGANLAFPNRTSLLVGLAAGLLLGASLWPLELWLLAQSGLNKMLEERFGAVLLNLQTARESVGWGVLAIVIVPAILEELFFRGLLFNAIRRRAGAVVTIGATGGLFALTHVVLDGALGIERLVPSLLIGLILSTVCWTTGSVWPSMVLHVAHNAILLYVGISDSVSAENVPWQWLAAGALGSVLGAALICILVMRRAIKEEAPG